MVNDNCLKLAVSGKKKWNSIIKSTLITSSHNLIVNKLYFLFKFKTSKLIRV